MWARWIAPTVHILVRCRSIGENRPTDSHIILAITAARSGAGHCQFTNVINNDITAVFDSDGVVGAAMFPID